MTFVEREFQYGQLTRFIFGFERSDVIDFGLRHPDGKSIWVQSHRDVAVTENLRDQGDSARSQ